MIWRAKIIWRAKMFSRQAGMIRGRSNLARKGNLASCHSRENIRICVYFERENTLNAKIISLTGISAAWQLATTNTTTQATKSSATGARVFRTARTQSHDPRLGCWRQSADTIVADHREGRA